ncbi:MAG: TIGR02147 family protein [Kofleriaceae bacterium]|nr:TIGR02147 family protein [Kofleriaceae bacterium]
MARTAEPDVYGYLDYRAYLRDVYLTRKARGFSYRAFSRKAGLRSPNYLKMVIDAERNLTATMAERFGRALGLDAEATSYFTDLVAFGQASTGSERSRAYERLSSQARYRKSHKLELAHAAYHATWYMPAIRELAARADFRDDPAWIAAMLTPPISRVEARRAMAVLLELGLLVRTGAGRISQGDQPLVSTGPEARAVHIGSYHRAMIQRAGDAIDVVPSHDRDISSLTLCVGEGGLARLKDRIQRFRRELLELSTLEDEPRRVVQLNFQLFPLSRDLPDQHDPEDDGDQPAGTKAAAKHDLEEP